MITFQFQAKNANLQFGKCSMIKLSTVLKNVTTE